MIDRLDGSHDMSEAIFQRHQFPLICNNSSYYKKELFCSQGTRSVENDYENSINSQFNLSSMNIIECFELRKKIFTSTATK